MQQIDQLSVHFLYALAAHSRDEDTYVTLIQPDGESGALFHHGEES